MEYTKIKNINEYVSESINPMKTPDTVFEIYSVPIYETGHPEYLRGSEIASNKTIVRKNDVLLCKINPRINRVWVVGDESQYQNIASSEWIVIRTSEYNPEFLAWYFRNPKFQKLMMSEVTGIGGSLTRAQPKAVAEYPVPVLPRLEQDAIAEVLNRVNDIINGRKRELQILDDLVKARFVELFGNLVSGDKIKTNKHKIGDIAFVTKLAGFEFTKYVQYKDYGDIIMLRGLNCKKGKLILDDIKWIDKTTSDLLPRSKLYYGDILMTYAGTIGDVAMVDADNKYHLAPNVAKITLKEKLYNPVFLMHLFLYTNDYIMSFASKVAQASINMEKIRNFEYFFPDADMQNQFAAFVEQTNKSKAVIQKALDEAQLLFDSLMQKYFG